MTTPTESKHIELEGKRLILDGTKIGWHSERVERWDAGERIAPVSVDLALTRACQASCRGCYAVLQESQERSNVDERSALNLLDDFAEIGVKAISIVSDGESTLSKAFVPFILHAQSLGIDVGLATNGWRLFPEVSYQILPAMSWIRFTVLAGTADSYTRMMHHDAENLGVFDQAMSNIRAAQEIREKENLDVTLGIQTFITPNDADEVRAFAQLGHDLGVQYAVIKHTSDDERGSYGIDYGGYDSDDLQNALRGVERTSTDKTKVIVKWNKMRDGNKPPYRRFYAPQFLLQISGSGLVAPSGMFFNARYSKFHIGDYTEQRFIDMWRGEHYWRVMDYLESPRFEASKHLGALPIQHYTNVALDRHVQGIEPITQSVEPEPWHVNFL